MLKINRIKAISKTNGGNFGFDIGLRDGLNLISSNENTRGKSSVIVAIYYCLGFEQIVGGIGHKTLTSVYKSSVTDIDQNSYDVLESEVFLEISNGNDTITVYRATKMEGRSDNLVTVYFSNLDAIYNHDTYIEDMYVLSQNAASSQKGFHFFLEKFLSLNLPLVPSNDEKEYKLYIQLIFSCIFIEQKRGWADLFSAMPILGILDAKKRIAEYLLNLDTFKNERDKATLKLQESSILNRWEIVFSEVISMCNRENCRIVNVPNKPRILEPSFFDHIQVLSYGNEKTISEVVQELSDEYNAVSIKAPKVVDNFDALQNELEITEVSIEQFETLLQERRNQLHAKQQSLIKLQDNLEIIQSDIRNNKDALKLKNMGSELNISSFSGSCPLCNQPMADSLLPIQCSTPVMSIEENIKHLESQRDMVLFAISANRKAKDELDKEMQSISGRIFSLRRLAKAIRSDLYSVNEDISETIVLKRIQIGSKITSLKELQNNVTQRMKKLEALSEEWKIYLENKQRLPKTKFSSEDEKKIESLEKWFKSNLEKFRYSSVSNYSRVEISRENYLPISDGFDMKFDSSASDNIRAIWAYTLGLLQASNETSGNHPRIILFDEPAQHSIVSKDVKGLFSTILTLGPNNQVIFGITLGDSDTQSVVTEIDKDLINIIDVGDHAFKRIS